MALKKLWEGSIEFKKNSGLSQYMHWLKEQHGLLFDNYEALWKWSIENVEDFWESIYNYFDVKSYSDYKSVLSDRSMPGSKWFQGASLNYAEHLLRNSRGEETAIYFGNERGEIQEMSWIEMKQKVASLASYLKKLGVVSGDRVVAFLPNVPEASIAFLAVNSLGAVWSSTSPDFGMESVVDRFAQIKPKVLIAVDGYEYNGKAYEKTEVVNSIVNHLPSLEKVMILPYLDKKNLERFPDEFIDLNECLKEADAELEFTPVDFDHPMWVLYSSGTTG